MECTTTFQTTAGAIIFQEFLQKPRWRKRVGSDEYIVVRTGEFPIDCGSTKMETESIFVGLHMLKV